MKLGALGQIANRRGNDAVRTAAEVDCFSIMRLALVVATGSANEVEQRLVFGP